MTTVSLTLPLSLQCSRMQNSRVFFSKSVKKSAKCGVRVLLARASHALRKKTDCPFSIFFPVFLASLPSLALCFQPRSRPFVWLPRVLEYAKIRTVLQSNSALILAHAENSNLIGEKLSECRSKFSAPWKPLFHVELFVLTRQGTIKDNNTE